MEEQSSASDAPQFYEVVVMDGNKPEEDVMDTSAEGITVTLKDSTTDEDVPMSVSTSEGILVPQNVVSQGDIQIAELQTAGDQSVEVVYTSASDISQYVSHQTVASSGIDDGVATQDGEEEEGGPGVQHKIVVQGKAGNQQIVIGEVQTLPQDIQATILSSIEEIQAATMEEDVQEVPDTLGKAGKDGAADTSGDPDLRSVSSITTCSRDGQSLDDMVPPQILATEDENTGPDDIPVESVVDDEIPPEVKEEALHQQDVTDPPSSQEGKVLEGTVISEQDASEEMADNSEKDTEEVSMAKFAPLMLSPVKDSKSSEDIPIDKPRIVSISHGRAGSEGNGHMEVPNFMDGTDNGDDHEGISLVQGGAAILTSVDAVSASQAYTIGPSTSSKLDRSNKPLAASDSQPPESLLENDEEPQKEKSTAAPIGKSPAEGKQKGKKGKNEMLHGMELLSECAMRLENNDGSPDEEEGAPEDGSKETQLEGKVREDSGASAEPEVTDDATAPSPAEVIVDAEPEVGGEVTEDQNVEISATDGDEVPADDGVQGLGDDRVQITVDDGVQISVDDGVQISVDDGVQISVDDGVDISVTDGGEGQSLEAVDDGKPPEEPTQEEMVEVTEPTVQEVDLNIQQLGEGGVQVGEFIPQVTVTESVGPLQTTTEVVVTSEGQVLKAIPGSNFVPVEIGNSQEVVIDSQQISEELIPMVQEEVILEIVEGDQIIVNNAGHTSEQLVTDLYEEQAFAGNKPYLPVQEALGTVQGIMPLVQQGMPSSYRPQTYSQELKHAKKKSKKKATKRRKSSSPARSRKQMRTEPARLSGDNGKQKYQCHVCQKLFEKMKELRDHLLVHYNTNGYVCDFCNKTFASSSHLRRHVMIHTGERPHKCDYCGEGFIQAVQLRVHKHRHGHGPPPPLSRAPPKKRGSGSGSGGSSSGGSTPRATRKNKRNKPTKTEKGEKYQCPICKVKHKSKRKIKAHMKSHVTAKNFKCGHCPEVFANKNQLTIHEARHKGKPELQCAYCEKAFDTTSHMKRHERIHTGEKPYKCKFCDKCFIQGVQLRLHERIHTGERPHVCTFCGKSFARTQYLKRHSCIHTGEKPLQCRFCLERFVQPVQRQQHEKKLHKKKLKKLLAQKQKPGQPPIKLVLRLKKKKGRKGEEEVTDSDDSDSESESSDSNDSN